MMRYKDYVAKVEFDDEAGLLHGEVINTRDVITFQGKSVDETRQAFHESVDTYLSFCEIRGEEPEKPFSGKFMVRVSSELHQRVFVASQREGKSLNAWVVDVLDRVSSVREERVAPLPNMIFESLHPEQRTALRPYSVMISGTQNALYIEDRTIKSGVENYPDIKPLSKTTATTNRSLVLVKDRKTVQ